MAFRFPLATVLLFRQNLEHQQELLFQESHQRVERVRIEIESVDFAMTRIAEREAQQIMSGLSAAELQFDLLCRSVLVKRRNKLEKDMAQAEQVIAVRREVLRLARQQREVLDTLKTQQLEIYLQQQTRQEQRSLDDLFLLRRAFLRRN
jgi:flagellar export protein FliJ